jgi:hypothetical protein
VVADVINSQAELLLAIQLHPAVALMLILPVPPLDPKDTLLGETDNGHSVGASSQYTPPVFDPPPQIIIPDPVDTALWK